MNGRSLFVKAGKPKTTTTTWRKEGKNFFFPLEDGGEVIVQGNAEWEPESVNEEPIRGEVKVSRKTGSERINILTFTDPSTDLKVECEYDFFEIAHDLNAELDSKGFMVPRSPALFNERLLEAENEGVQDAKIDVKILENEQEHDFSFGFPKAVEDPVAKAVAIKSFLSTKKKN